MAINILVKSVNVSLAPQEPTKLLILIDVSGNQTLPKEIGILGSSFDVNIVGHAISHLLHVLKVPSLHHIQDVPAMIDFEGDNWYLMNFLDDTLIFNAELILKALTETENEVQSETSTN